MCNLYGTTDAQHLRSLLFAKTLPATGWDMTVAPLKTGVFIRQHGEAMAGQWGMLPPGATDRVPRSRTAGRPLSTNNARRETVATAWTFRFPWARWQRCLIPAWWYQEPYWGISHTNLMTARHASTRTAYFAAKAVVDDGGKNKGDSFHRIACLLSAKFVVAAIRSGVADVFKD